MKKTTEFNVNEFFDSSLPELYAARRALVARGNKAISNHEYLYVEEIKSVIAEIDLSIKNKKSRKIDYSEEYSCQEHYAH